MILVTGDRLGPYEILGAIGAGGMGEVYRARDTRLHREVAIKVLPASFSQDAGRLRRFEQEARAASALNHPGILTIYDFGDHEGSPYLVAELLEGETLRERLAGDRLPLRKALDYAIQIAHGLAAAHEKGIVHRDLKPENLFVTTDGRVKILDFGLAKLARPETDGAPLTTETTEAAATEPGVAMGTVGYMSPEQVRGLATDSRSDLFSFGAVLYEMLTGERAFRRDTQVETLTAILKEDPPEPSRRAAELTASIDRIVRHCLEKSPQERFQSARDLAFDLEALSAGPASPTLVAGKGRPALGPRPLVLALLVLAGILLGSALMRLVSRSPAAGPPRLRYLSYSGRDESPTVSPDGRTIAFTSSRDGRPRIWLKQIASGTETVLTSGIDVSPRFSPDGETILFRRLGEARTSVYRVSVLGGEPRKLVDDAGAADWSPDGRRIVFVGGDHRTLRIASADGTGGHEIARVRGLYVGLPRWSPDGRWVAAHLTGSRAPAEVFLVEVGSGRNRRIPTGGEGPLQGLAWSGRGRELVFAQADSQTGDYLSSPGRIVARNLRGGKDRVLLWSPGLGLGLDIVAPGSVVFSANSPRQNLRELPVGADAHKGNWLTRGQTTDRQPVYSPDGETVLFSSNRAGNNDLWILERKTGSLRRVTEDPGDDWDPAFLPDGKRIVWSSNRGGHFEVWISDSDGSGARQVSRDGTNAENPTSGGDGSWIVYSSLDPAKRGLWKIRPDGSDAKLVVAADSDYPQVSPDGRFAAYRVSVTGRGFILRAARVSDGVTVFETPLPSGPSSTGRPRWTPDGGAIVFTAADANARLGIFVQDFRPGEDTLKTRRILAAPDPDSPLESFGISPDGSRITISFGERFSALMLAEGVPGIELPERGGNSRKK